MASTDDEFQELLDLVCDGQLTAEQESRLAELLEGSPERQREYLQYIDLHARMQAEQVPALPPVKSVTLKQMTVEFGHDGSSPTHPGQRRLTGPQKPMRKGLLALLLLVIVAIPVLSWFFSDLFQGQGDVLAVVESMEPRSVFSNWKPGAELRFGKYELPTGELQLKMGNGTLVTLNGPGTIEIEMDDQLAVVEGDMSVSAKSRNEIYITYDEIEFKGHGNFEIRTTADPEMLELRILTGSVNVNPSRARPRHFWQFSGKGSRVQDKYGNADGVLGKGTRRVGGLVPTGGAIEFDNTPDAAIAVGSGGGDALGTGTFAVSDGITLEAYMRPYWSGKGYTTGDEPDYDEIIRKEGDGELRFLLSFQNDDPAVNDYSFPKRKPGPVLAFGLYLIGEGYQELEVPLEGEAAPITLDELKNGETHHVAATYRTSSGLKEIYIDGKQVACHQYPPGTRPLTGGPGEVVIGNIAPPGEGADEPFHGILDDVAFYDFALTNLEIERHADSRTEEFEHAYFLYQDSYDYTVSVTTFIERSTGLPIKITSPKPPAVPSE
ncbi:MAG: hypothetical protein CMJ46_08965 [Planctomyces sp.]|nr:hypothetical protein [Planctomyces sp.]